MSNVELCLMWFDDTKGRNLKDKILGGLEYVSSKRKDIEVPVIYCSLKDTDTEFTVGSTVIKPRQYILPNTFHIVVDTLMKS